MRVLPKNTNVSSSTYTQKSNYQSNEQLSKKQKQNAKKAAKQKLEKQEQQSMQAVRLKDYRKAQEKEFVNKLAEKDKLELRKKTLERGTTPVIKQLPVNVTEGTWYSSQGKPIWEE